MDWDDFTYALHITFGFIFDIYENRVFYLWGTSLMLIAAAVSLTTFITGRTSRQKGGAEQ